MFAVTNAICDNLRAKKKWKKEHCVLCSMPVSKCKKLQEDEDRRREDQSDKFDETREMAKGVSARVEDFTNPYEYY